MALVVAKVRTDVVDDPAVRETLGGFIVADVPVAAGEMVADSATVPLKPVLDMVHVDIAEPAGRMLAGLAGPQETENVPPATVRVTVAVWLMVPLIPVMVIVYVPAGVDAVVPIVRVEVPLEPGVRGMLVGAKVKLMPVAAGETVAESATLPVKPRLLAVIVEVADCPEVIVLGVAALAASVKSAAIVIETVAVWDTVPAVPVTVTV